MNDGRITALVVAHDARAPGGVGNFLRVMRVSYRGKVKATRFANGPRHNERGKLKKLVRFAADYARFAIHLRRTSYDIIHVNPTLDYSSFPREIAFLYIAKVFQRKAKTLLFFRGWRNDAIEKISQNSALTKILLHSIKRADRIFVLSNQFKLQLEKIGVESEKIFVLSTTFEGKKLQAYTHLPKEQKSILFMSRFLKAKGGVETIEAFANIVTKHPSAKLYMAGDGPEMENLVSTAKNLNLSERVIFTGYLSGEAKMKLLATSELFVLPTTHPEGMPNAILEAMASGQAILTTAVGGISDVVQDGVSGRILIEPLVTSTAKALDYYLSNPEALTSVQEHNRKIAWSNWESGIVSNTIQEHYLEMMAS